MRIPKSALKIRIAQTDLTCDICGKEIPAGHKYTWKQKKLDGVIRMLRACERCING